MTHWGNMEPVTYHGLDFSYDVKVFSGEYCAGFEWVSGLILKIKYI
jgi:hypothetical protein